MAKPSTAQPLDQIPASSTFPLTFKGVSKRYDNGVTALNNISLTINPGEFTILLGASGSGKTTLLKTAIGLVRPDAGEIHVEGVPMQGKTLADARSRLSMIHQDFGLVNRLSVAQNVMAGVCTDLNAFRLLFQLYPEAIQKKAADLLDAVGLKPVHFNQRARNLSGGQMQRVGIARALMRAPSLLLADEPIASLDPVSSETIMQLLKQLGQERQIGILCSLHQISFARRFADRIIAMQAGEVVYDGTPENLSDTRLDEIFGRRASHLHPVEHEPSFS